MHNWHDVITERLGKVTTFRERQPKILADPRLLILEEKSYLNFISNDYLGLSIHPRVVGSAIAASHKFGIGSTGAPTLGGYTTEHDKLSFNLASWLGFEKVLLFSSGYHLNIGIYSQLIDENTIVWLDKNCHASHIDGLLLAKTRFSTFKADEFDDVAYKIQAKTDMRHIILSEGIFSMDGCCNYLTKLIELKRQCPHNVLLIIDDAHGIGALGKNGLGSLEQLKLDYRLVDLYIGTLSKTFASYGGFVCGNSLIINYLQQTARSQIFSTALPALIAAAANASLEIISSQAGASLRSILHENIVYFQETSVANNLPVHNLGYNFSPIQVLVFDNPNIVEYLHGRLLKHHIRVGKMLYPTVPKTKPRLRISLTASHIIHDIQVLCESLNKFICEWKARC